MKSISQWIWFFTLLMWSSTSLSVEPGANELEVGDIIFFGVMSILIIALIIALIILMIQSYVDKKVDANSQSSFNILINKLQSLEKLDKILAILQIKKSLNSPNSSSLQRIEDARNLSSEKMAVISNKGIHEKEFFPSDITNQLRENNNKLGEFITKFNTIERELENLKTPSLNAEHFDIKKLSSNIEWIRNHLEQEKHKNLLSNTPLLENNKQTINIRHYRKIQAYKPINFFYSSRKNYSSKYKKCKKLNK